MLLMMLIMGLPLLGIASFFTLSMGVALPAYPVMTGFSGLYHRLTMRAMRLPVGAGAETLAGSTIVHARTKSCHQQNEPLDAAGDFCR